jgi:hypothetical protein
MIKTLSSAAALVALTAISALAPFAATPAFSQAPSEAQRSAIRSACRADYQANCASIPPGGAASLQCLQKNISNLSPSCQSAVRAVAAPAEPKADAKPESGPPAATTETAPMPAAPKAAASAAVKKPDNAKIAAIRSACRADYQSNCAGVPTGGAAALKCLRQNEAKLSASCQRAVDAAGGSPTTPAAGGAPAPANTAAPEAVPDAAPAAAMVLRPMRPREVIFVLRSACGEDVRTLCAGVPPGGGRIIQCLATKAAALSPACADVLGQFAAR